MKKNNDEKKQQGLDEGMVRKIVMSTIVGAIVLGILVTFIFNRGGTTTTEEDPVEDAPQEEEVIEDDRDKLLEDVEGKEGEAKEETGEDSVEARAKKSREEAKANLEKSDEPIDEDLSEEEMVVLTKDLQELFDFLGKDYDNYKGGDGNYFASSEYAKSIAKQTEPYMGQQINIAQRFAGYKMAPETAEWFYSETDEVYQFAVSMKAEGRDDLVFSGNYNKDDRFFKIFKMHGELDVDEFAS